MVVLTFAIRWSWILGIALFLPVDLPVGGGERYQSEVCRCEGSTSFLSGDSCVLKASPLPFSPNLRTVQIGTPLRVLRSWQSNTGEEWFQVQIASNSMLELAASVRRGWVNV